MSRAHINRPVLDANGNVLSDIHVKIYEPGTTSLISEPIYLDGTTTTLTQQPMTFPNGVISIYLDSPKRVRIGVQQGVGQEVFFEDIDILAPAGGGGFRAGTGAGTVVGGDLNSDASSGGTNSLILGDGTITQGDQNTVVGNTAHAASDYDTVVGFDATADQPNAVAVGNDATVSGAGGTAVGSGAWAAADSALAVGHQAEAHGARSMAFGEGAISNEDDVAVVKIDQLELQPSSGGGTTYAVRDTAGVKHTIGVDATGNLTVDGIPVSGTRVFSLQGIVSGTLAVANNVLKPGLRVVSPAAAKFLVAHIGTVPTGADVHIDVERWNGSAASPIGTIVIVAGAGAGSTAVNVDCAQGDMIRFNVTQVGSTVAGADVNLSVDFA